MPFPATVKRGSVGSIRLEGLCSKDGKTHDLLRTMSRDVSTQDHVWPEYTRAASNGSKVLLDFVLMDDQRSKCVNCGVVVEHGSNACLARTRHRRDLKRKNHCTHPGSEAARRKATNDAERAARQLKNSRSEPRPIEMTKAPPDPHSLLPLCSSTLHARLTGTAGWINTLEL